MPILAWAALVALGASGWAARSPPEDEVVPDSTDRALLRVVEAAVNTGARGPAPWPGYDAASEPLLVYRVGRWSVLLNPPSSIPAAGWERYPASWPEVSRPAWLDSDGDPGLVGQLVFDHEVPGGLVAAVPLYEELPPQYRPRDLHLYAFLAHEAFHQFQRHRFSDTETPSEERYPMLDPTNNALASLELRALEAAVEAAARGDGDASREAAGLASAVHDSRWERLDEGARAIERSLEVVEGTAKYVEIRAVVAFGERCRAGTPPDVEELCGHFAEMDAARWLGEEVDLRLREGAILPEDMPRNRIYPVAGAVALLLDVHEPGWKKTVEKEGTGRGLFEHLGEALGLPAADRSALVDQAQERYGWQGLLTASRVLVRKYQHGLDQALGAFAAEAGTRVVVRVPPIADLSRSRSSRERRWVADSGRRTLGRFDVYTLRRRSEPALDLRIEKAQVLDETGHDGSRVVTFRASGRVVITADGQPIGDECRGGRDFEVLSLETDGTALRTGLGGTLTVRPGLVSVDVRSPSRSRE